MARKINRLLEKAEELGYSGPTDLHRRSGCPISFETIRIAVWEGRAVSVPSLILIMKIMKYLEFSPAEIRDYLIAQGEKEFSQLLGDSTVSIVEWQKIILRYLDALRKESPENYNHVVDVLLMALKSESIEVAEKDATRIKARG